MEVRALMFAIAAIGTISSPLHAVAQDGLPTKEAIDAQLKEAQSIQVLSNDPQIIFQQLERTDDTISELQAQIGSPNYYQRSVQALDDFDKKLKAVTAFAANVNCTDNVKSQELYGAADGLYEASNRTRQISYDANLADIAKLVDGMMGGGCDSVKSNFSAGNRLTTLETASAALRKYADERSADYEQRRSAMNSVVAELQKKSTELSEALKSAKTKEQLGENLWLIIAVLAAVGIATILAVRLFEIEIQIEWVASGQITQFVTVMILLSAILGLGLSDVLKEETLGTLLGGVSGYVLSQGVGRAAARAAARQVRSEQPSTTT